MLAGGQSLLLEMHLKRLDPDLVVDVNRVPGLDRLTVDDGAVEVGALVRHRVFESPQAVPGPLGRPVRAGRRQHRPPAHPHPGHHGRQPRLGPPRVGVVRPGRGPGRRDRPGQRPGRPREVAAGDYFLGPFRTARRPDELITAVRFPC